MKRTGFETRKHTVGTQRVKDVVWNLFPQTQYRKLSCQSTGLALYPGGGMVDTSVLSADA